MTILILKAIIIACMVICTLMLLRNEYVFSIFMQIHKAIYLYSISDYAIDARLTYMRLYNYNTMLFRFWVFDWRQFMPDDLADKIAPYMRIVQEEGESR